MPMDVAKAALKVASFERVIALHVPAACDQELLS